jgi:hypothetical protein
MEKIVVALASQYGWQMEHLDVRQLLSFVTIKQVGKRSSFVCKN